MSALRLIDGRHGRFLANPKDYWIGRALWTYGEYSEIECRALCGLLDPHSIVVEVGANVGALTVPMAKKAGIVVALEPQRVIFQQLCANLALNEITNVLAYWAAADEKPGKAVVPSMQLDADQNNGGQKIDGHTEGDPVQVLTVDGLGLGGCTLLKIDVEGMERRVILGAAKTIERYKPHLYVENDRVEGSAELIETILGLGYRAFWHTPPLFNEENHAGEKEDVWEKDNGRRFLSFNMFCVHLDHIARAGGRTPNMQEVLRGDTIATLLGRDPEASDAQG